MSCATQGRSRAGAGALALACALAMAANAGAEQSPNRVTAVRVTEQGSRTVITVVGSARPAYNVYSLRSPDRLVVDLAGSSLEGLPTHLREATSQVDGIALSERSGRRGQYGRMVVNLRGEVAYRTRVRGESLEITLTSAPTGAPSVAEAGAEATERARSERQREEELARRARSEADRAAADRARDEQAAEAARRSRAEAEAAVRQAEAQRARVMEARRREEAALERIREARQQVADAGSVRDRRAAEQVLARARAEGERLRTEVARLSASLTAAQREAQERQVDARRAARARREAEATARQEATARVDAERRAQDAERLAAERAEALTAAQRHATQLEGRAAEAAQRVEAAEQARQEARAAAARAESEARAALTAREEALETVRRADGETKSRARREAQRLAAAAAEAREQVARAQAARERAEGVARESAEAAQRVRAELEQARTALEAARASATRAEARARDAEQQVAAATQAREEAERAVVQERRARQETERALALAVSQSRGAEQLAQQRAEAMTKAQQRAETLGRASAEARQQAQQAERDRAAAEARATEAIAAARRATEAQREALAAARRVDGEGRAAARREAERLARTATEASREAARAQAAREEAARAARAALQEAQRVQAQLQGAGQALERARTEAAQAEESRRAAEARAEQAERARDAALARAEAAESARREADQRTEVAQAARAAAEQQAEAARAEATRRVAEAPAPSGRGSEEAAAGATDRTRPLTQEEIRLQRLAKLRGEPVPERRAAAAARASAEPAEEQTRPRPPRVRDVRFSSDDDVHSVVIDMSGRVEYTLSRDTAGNATLQLHGAVLPGLLERTLDVGDIDGPVGSISSFVSSESGDAVVEVDVRQGARSRVRRDGTRVVLEFRPASGDAVVERGGERRASGARRPAGVDRRPGSVVVAREDVGEYQYGADEAAGFVSSVPMESRRARERRSYRGRRIDLDFKDADIHNILRLLSDVGRVNIIAADDVSGAVTIKMRNVPWDQALDVILRSKGLGMQRDGNLIRVAPLTQLEKEREMELARRKHAIQLAPLETRIIPISYAMAEELLPRAQELVSSRGNISMDARTNVLIARDLEGNLDQIEELIRALDTQTPQVLIEARIVEATSAYERELGIQWGGDFVSSAATGNPTGIVFPSSIGLGGGATDGETPVAGLALTQGAMATPNFAVNLPATVGTGQGGALALTMGSVDGNAHLNIRLSAMEDTGTLRIISSPRILTLDNSEAHIEQGTLIPYSQISAQGVQTAFQEAKLNLTVTPHVTADGSVMMKLRITRDEPDFNNRGARGDPTILKREAETQFLVRDGHTVVIGGIYTRNTGVNYGQVPGLARIPILGWLFKNRRDSDRRSEMLIFITPRIVNRAESIGR